jgi:glycosyltransferase involved in cell wall biosynthesis
VGVIGATGAGDDVTPVRVLVVTVVHTPLDARIFHREIAALRTHGVQVAYAAPWAATGTEPPSDDPGLRPLELPRASGRRRARSLLAARRLVRRLGPQHDLVLLHDPELLLAVAGQRDRLPPIVLDVHEDTATSLIDRPWVPTPLRSLLGRVVRRAERWAEDHLHLLLAERAYQQRFRRAHPFVPNVPPPPGGDPPPPGDERVVYLGRLARSRGAIEMLEVASRLHGEFRFELIGMADADVEPLVAAAAERGELTWSGFVPNDEALPRIEGAMAGLSLVHPQPNHAVSLQTKVLEYPSRRVPVISTDLPVTGPFVRDHGIGVTVPPEDPDAVVAALRALRDDPEERRAMAERGFGLVRDELNWDVAGHRFVTHLLALAGRPSAADDTSR